MKPDDRLAVALWEADRHAAALSDALAEWAVGPALDMAQLERDRLLLRLTDQILFRFTKLRIPRHRGRPSALMADSIPP